MPTGTVCIVARWVHVPQIHVINMKHPTRAYDGHPQPMHMCPCTPENLVRVPEYARVMITTGGSGRQSASAYSVVGAPYRGGMECCQHGMFSLRSLNT